MNLVLTRKPGEKICVGDDLTVTVVEVMRNGSVRLGFEGDPSIPIYREEVYLARRAGEER